MSGLYVKIRRQVYVIEDVFLKTQVSALYIQWNITRP